MKLLRLIQRFFFGQRNNSSSFADAIAEGIREAFK